MKCIYCNHSHTYLLADKQRKCSRCKRKFSPKKIEREEKLYDYFLQTQSARSVALKTGMHFATVQKYFDKFRYKIALKADALYAMHADDVDGYDEYLYLPKSLSPKKNIHKLQHFLTLSYHDKVYSIMMPKAKHSVLEQKDEEHQRLLLKYLRFNTVSKLSKSKNIITEFWSYFEEFICRYKGINDDKFIYYLKEAEWRFNLSQVHNTFK